MKLVRLGPGSKASPENNFEVIVNPSELVGMDDVWALALNAQTRAVAKVRSCVAHRVLCLCGWVFDATPVDPHCARMYHPNRTSRSKLPSS